MNKKPHNRPIVVIPQVRPSSSDKLRFAEAALQVADELAKLEVPTRFEMQTIIARGFYEVIRQVASLYDIEIENVHIGYLESGWNEE